MKKWPFVLLETVCTKIQDGAHRSPQVLYSEPGSGRFPYLTSTNIRTGYLRLNSIQYCDEAFHNEIYPRCNAELGDVLLTKDGANTGNVAINTFGQPFSLLSSVCLLKTNPDKLLARFLYYYLQSDEGLAQITGQMTGAAIKRIILKTIKKSSLPLPPLPEQQRIVRILDEAFAGLATAEANASRNLQNAREIFDSHLHAVFSQPGEGWVETTIGDVIRFIDYRGKTPTKTGRGIRLITAKNIKMGYLQEEPMEFIASDDYEGWMTRGIPEKGDVLFTTEAPLANVAQLDTDDKVAFAQRVIIMQPDKQKLDPTFLKFLLLSGPAQIAIRSQGTGATVQGIKASLLKQISISFPTDLSSQRRTVGVLDSLSQGTQRLVTVYQRKLDLLDELKKSLLREAFSGTL